MEKQDKNQYPYNRQNQQPTGFISSLENLSNNLLEYVTADDRNNGEDQLQ